MLSTSVPPQEIIVLIIRLLRRDAQALLNLCLTSSDFLGEARNLLYSDIRIRKKRFTISRNSNPISLDVAKSDKLFMTLTTHNTSLAARIESFAYLTDFPCSDEEYMNLVNRTFRLIINVKRLTLCSDFIIPGLFDGCTFRLESLCCTATQSLTHTAGRDEICRFLFTQPDLKSLLLNWEAGPLPLTLCPRLETLRGGYRSVECLLPGRSTVRHLEWIRHEADEDLSNPTRQLSTELRNLTTLALGGINDRIPLRSLMPYLTSLRVLRLMGFSKSQGTHELEHDLPLLRNLRTFVWSTGNFRFSLSAPHKRALGQDEQRQSILAHLWFAKMDALDKVYFQVGDRRLGMKNYAYWKRGEIEPTYADHNEALVANGLSSWFS